MPGLYQQVYSVPSSNHQNRGNLQCKKMSRRSRQKNKCIDKKIKYIRIKELHDLAPYCNVRLKRYDDKAMTTKPLTQFQSKFVHSYIDITDLESSSGIGERFEVPSSSYKQTHNKTVTC